MKTVLRNRIRLSACAWIRPLCYWTTSPHRGRPARLLWLRYGIGLWRKMPGRDGFRCDALSSSYDEQAVLPRHVRGGASEPWACRLSEYGAIESILAATVHDRTCVSAKHALLGELASLTKGGRDRWSGAQQSVVARAALRLTVWTRWMPVWIGP